MFPFLFFFSLPLKIKCDSWVQRDLIYELFFMVVRMHQCIIVSVIEDWKTEVAQFYSWWNLRLETWLKEKNQHVSFVTRIIFYIFFFSYENAFQLETNSQKKKKIKKKKKMLSHSRIFFFLNSQCKTQNPEKILWIIFRFGFIISQSTDEYWIKFIYIYMHKKPRLKTRHN